VYALVQRLRRVAREAAGNELEIEDSALAILDASVAFARGTCSGPAPAAARRRRRAERVRELLAARGAARITLDDVAREVGVSPFHLAREFHDETGLPIHRYLNRLRLRTALARLVRDGDDLTSVALDTGFSSHAHFSDAFRREFGRPPSAFRRRLARGELAQFRKILEA
jgi:AraC-like DNA-binding protein